MIISVNEFNLVALGVSVLQGWGAEEAEKNLNERETALLCFFVFVLFLPSIPIFVFLP